MTTREEIHRLVDAVPDDRLDAVSEVVRAVADPGLTYDVTHLFQEAEPVRTFASAGTLSAEHDLAERVEDIFRTEDHDAA